MVCVLHQPYPKQTNKQHSNKHGANVPESAQHLLICIMAFEIRLLAVVRLMVVFSSSFVRFRETKKEFISPNWLDTAAWEECVRVKMSAKCLSRNDLG